MRKASIPNIYLYIPIVLLGLHLIFRLIDQANLISTFPLDKFNDWSSYMAQLHFLKECGFHNLCQYWYNGFINFQINQPGWYFFIYPLFLLTKNVQLTAYLSILITFILTLLALFISRKRLNLNKIQITALFLFFFGNAIAIGNFIRVGKIHQLFAWFTLIVIFLFLLIYKDKKIDKKFFLIIPFYFFAILTHQNSAIIASLAILGLFLIKDLKQKLLILLATIITITATSFWWIPYIQNFFATTSKTIIVANSLKEITKATLNDNLVAIIIPITFLITLYFYLKSNKNRKKEFIFFLPLTLISILLLTRLILFIPIIKQVFPDSYSLFLLFFIIFMFFKIDFNLIKKYKHIIFIGLILITILSISLSIKFTPLFAQHTELEEEVLAILPEIDEKFIILKTPSRRTSYPQAYYSYAAIFHNKSTSAGWYPSLVSPEYLKKIDSLDSILISENYSLLKQELKELNTFEVLAFDDYCTLLQQNGFNNKINKSRVCILTLK